VARKAAKKKKELDAERSPLGCAPRYITTRIDFLFCKK
jgi:hypothetical protein